MARTLSIDLGAHAVKVAMWPGVPEGAPEAEVAQAIPQDGTLAPPMGDRLAALDLVLRAHPEWVSGAHVVVGWPTERTATHRVKMPFDDLAQIAATLPFTLEAEVPFDLDAMVVGWRKGEAPGEVLVTLVRRDELEVLLEGLEQRGINPRKVICAGDALALHAHEPDRVVAIVDVGHESTLVVVARGGRTLTWRASSVGGRAATKAIQGALDTAWAAAQALKHGGEDPFELLPEALGDDEAGPALFDPGTDPSTQTERTDPAFERLPGKAKEALDATLGLLLAEVRATLVQAEDEHGVGIEELVLVGAGSRIPELRGWLEQDLGLPVQHARIDGVLVPDSFAFARALGLGLAPEAHVTDLRTGDLAYKGGFDNLRLVFTYGIAFVAIFLVAAVGSTGWRLWQLSSERADLESRVRAEVAAVVEDLPEELTAGDAVALLAERVIEAQTEAEFLGSEDEAPPTVDLLYRLTTAFPPPGDVRVSVDTLEISPKAVQIEGTTEGFSQVDRIGEALTANGGFGAVEATPGNKDGKGRLAFTVSIDRGGSTDTDAVEEEGGASSSGEEG